MRIWLLDEMLGCSQTSVLLANRFLMVWIIFCICSGICYVVSYVLCDLVFVSFCFYPSSSSLKCRALPIQASRFMDSSPNRIMRYVINLVKLQRRTNPICRTMVTPDIVLVVDDALLTQKYPKQLYFFVALSL